MGTGKIDRSLPSGKQASKAGLDKSLGEFRTHKDHGDDGSKDEFHVHDDKNGLRFCMKGIRRFELAARTFLASLSNYPDGAKVVFPGEPAKKKGDKSRACDLVFQRKGNKWEVGLFLCGQVVGDVVQGDEVLVALDELIQRS